MSFLLDVSSAQDQARLFEQGGGIGASLMSVPRSGPLQFAMSTDRYRLALKWWLGVPLMEAASRCPGCLSSVDEWGDHLLCCPRNNFLPRHQAVQGTLVEFLSQNGIRHAVEVAIPGEDITTLRPADILLMAWEGGMDCAVDVTMAHGWQASEQRSSEPVASITAGNVGGPS